MATLKQFEANRRNTQKSTGPKTPEGKAAVSMNSLRHGLRARTVVLPGENPEDFHQLCDDLEVEWHPQSRTEQFYVEQMAVSQWKLTRMEVVEVNIFKDTDAPSKQLPMLDRLWQAEARMERSYSRAQRELERLQASRPDQVQPPEEPSPATQPVAEEPPSTSAPAGAEVLHSAQFVAAYDDLVGRAPGLLPGLRPPPWSALSGASSPAFGCRYAAWWDRRFRLST
jgi:hypothetical protein